MFYKKNSQKIVRKVVQKYQKNQRKKKYQNNKEGSEKIGIYLENIVKLLIYCPKIVKIIDIYPKYMGLIINNVYYPIYGIYTKDTINININKSLYN